MLIRKMFNKIKKKIGTYSREYPVREIFQSQQTEYGYNRLDIIVRYLAIEEEYGKNEYGWQLYKKMQIARVGNEKCTINERVSNFKKLIRSWRKNGYLRDSLIELNADLTLFDGSHRFALALYYNLENINCKVNPTINNIVFDENWFLINEFTEEEIKIIKKKASELLNVTKQNVWLILWPSVYKYFLNITSNMKKLYNVVDVKDIEFSKETFTRFIKSMYKIDDIQEWKINRKIEWFNSQDKFTIRCIAFKSSIIKYRAKKINKKLILTQGEYIKKLIRSAYKNKVKNYIYDVICHTGDNYEHNEYIEKLIYPKFSLETYFNIIKDCKYLVCKFDTPYMTSDFPVSFPFGKDIDILCEKKEYEKILSKTIKYLSPICDKYYDKLKIVKVNNFNTHIRVELLEMLIYQFDITYQIDENITSEVISQFISRRKKIKNYYVTSIHDEILIRKQLCTNDDVKEYHKDFLKKHDV